LCTATGVAVDVTLNKYASILPWSAVLGLWAIPLVLFVVWFWRVERTTAWVKHRFLEHPFSYVLMFLILIPFGWGATATMISKLTRKTIAASPVLTSTLPPNIVPSPRPTAQSIVPGSTGTSQPALSLKTKPKEKQPPEPISPTPQSVPAQQPPQVGSVDCGNAGICAGVNNGVQQFNQFGAPKLVMTDAQRDAIRDAMNPYAGLKFTLMRHDATEDSMKYADQLKKALTDAGLVCIMDGSGTEFNGGVVPSGVSLLIGADEFGAANSLGTAMQNSGLLKGKLPASKNDVRSNGFDVTVAPNR